MAKTILALLAVVACATAEPPSGYSYHQPSILIADDGHGFDGFSNSIGIGGGGGGGYHAVSAGYQSNEGQYVDPHLLEEIKNILLKDELQNQQYRSSSSHGISGSYGVPSPVYGVPHYNERVVGIELGHVKQGIQVAQFEQAGHGGGGYASSGYPSGGGGGIHGGGGYFSGGISSGIHSISSDFSGSIGHGPSSSGHSNSYTTISIPAGSYGVPLPSTRYGSPHH